MYNKMFNYKVNLVPIDIPNQPQDEFRENLLHVPYLLYEVERLSNGDVIAINKPGGKKIMEDCLAMILWYLSVTPRKILCG